MPADFGFPRRIAAAQLASVLPPGGLTLVSGCSAESAVLAHAVIAAGAALGDMVFCGVVVGGLNCQNWLAGADTRFLTFFATPELRPSDPRVEFLPLCYADILAELRRRRPRAALFMCSPPDQAGHCSFGTEVAFIADLWRDIPIRIAHLNALMPRTAGDPGIPFAALTAYLEAPQPLPSVAATAADPVATAIAAHIAGMIEDGATLQTGLGRVPDAVLRGVSGRRGLRLHTGLVGDGVLDLIDAGALAGQGAAVVGVAIGSQRLYDRLDHPAFAFRPVSVTHDPARLAAIDRFVTINSALQIDLYGQAYAELTPGGWMSGPGGASDFARGARGGTRIVALPSTARDGAVSRIVPSGAGAGPVSLGRMDIDVVVTEHGTAELRAKTYAARAAALIAIAAPAHRGALWKAAVS